MRPSRVPGKWPPVVRIIRATLVILLMPPLMSTNWSLTRTTAQASITVVTGRVVNVKAMPVRVFPYSSSRQEGQLKLGDKVFINDEKGGWYNVTRIDDGAGQPGPSPNTKFKAGRPRVIHGWVPSKCIEMDPVVPSPQTQVPSRQQYPEQANSSNTNASTAGTALAGGVAGALLGAGLGALTAALTGGNVGGGAAAGAALGLVAGTINNYHAMQVRSAQEDQQMYGYSKVTSPAVKIRSASCSPERVRPGEEVSISLDYSVMLPDGISEVLVEESWIVKKNGKEVGKRITNKNKCEKGGRGTVGEIPVATNASLGIYSVEHTVQTGTSYDVMQTAFYVDN